MPLDEYARRRLASFVDRNKIVVVQPARRHAAGWIWTGRLGEAFEIVGEDHEPLKVLTIPADPGQLAVRFVACLAMRGEIDHVLQVTGSFARMQPVDDPEGLRASLRDQGESDWWQCPNSDRTRCHCLSMHHPRT